MEVRYTNWKQCILSKVIHTFESGPCAFPHLFKEAMLLVGNGCGSLRKLAPLLPQAGPHVLLLEQRVELS